jgi:threonine dehydrogenase-like Zn-dependent dehydrogenase
LTPVRTTLHGTQGHSCPGSPCGVCQDCHNREVPHCTAHCPGLVPLLQRHSILVRNGSSALVKAH